VNGSVDEAMVGEAAPRTILRRCDLVQPDPAQRPISAAAWTLSAAQRPVNEKCM
jgi:hypothetical protein